MTFLQAPPTLGNQYEDDRVLRSYLARVIGDELSEIEDSLLTMGELAGTDFYRMQLADRLNEPLLTQWDAWGNRVDQITLTPLWCLAERVAVEHGVVATAYEQKHGSLSRVHQCALAYLFTPSTDIYSCPLAMTDGAARTLISSKNQTLIDRAVPHLVTRNAEEFWTAGQWMTELTGGSDVGAAETIARQEQGDESGSYRLYGRKWFASAVSSRIALTLARPEGNPSGGRGLALFYIEMRDEHGRLVNIAIDRLKDKLGTRKVPTAELTLAGTPAQLVMGTTDGVRNITPLLNITRLWNGISSVALMRRGLTLAADYATKRVAFGAPLSEKPLHVDTIAGLQAEAEAAFHFAFYVAELTGRSETGETTDDETRLLRVLTPLMKLTTARQAVLVASEVLELFGGAGYVEDTGLPLLLRDSQVLPIWEGTTNVLALDALRALGVSRNLVQNVETPVDDDLEDVTSSTSAAREQNTDLTGTLGMPSERLLKLLKSDAVRCIKNVRDHRLSGAATVVVSAMDHAASWLTRAQREGRVPLEAGARRFALTLGRAMELALFIKHAQWSLDQESDGRSTASARRFASSGVDAIVDDLS